MSEPPVIPSSGPGADFAVVFETARALDRVDRDAQIEQDIARMSRLSGLLAALRSSSPTQPQE